MSEIEFADAIIACINEKDDWFIRFKAERGYHPRVILSRSGPIKVIVAPVRHGASRNDHTAWDHEFVIDVGIVKKLTKRTIEKGTEDNAEVDPLVNLVSQLKEWFLSDEYPIPEGFELADLPDRPTYDPHHLEQQRQFTAVVQLVFRCYAVPCG